MGGVGLGGGVAVWRRRSRCVTDLLFQLFTLSADTAKRGRKRRGKCRGESYLPVIRKSFPAVSAVRAIDKEEEKDGEKRFGKDSITSFT